jgi:hypothetical protein
MNFTKEALGGLVVPLLAIGYAVFALWEQFTGEYMELTTDYTLYLAFPVLVFGVLLMIHRLFPIIGHLAVVRIFVPDRSKSGEMSLEETAEAAASGPAARPGGWMRLAALVGLAFVLVLTIETVGYLIAFFLFTVLVLLAMGVRSAVTILAVAVATVLVVHFVFAGLIDMPLPESFLEEWLGGEE